MNSESHLRGSNSGPLRYECNALPTELRWLSTFIHFSHDQANAVCIIFDTNVSLYQLSYPGNQTILVYLGFVFNQ